MTPRALRRHRWRMKLLLAAAAAPLLGLTQCHTGANQVTLSVVNRTPQAAFFSLLSALFPDAEFNPQQQ